MILKICSEQEHLKCSVIKKTHKSIRLVRKININLIAQGEIKISLNFFLNITFKSHF